MKAYTKKGRLNKRSKKYRIIHNLWLKTEPYLCNNKLKPIEKVNKSFYDYLVRNKFSNDWDCWSICEKYVIGKEYKSNTLIIVPYGNAFGLKRLGDDKLVAIRNTKKQINEVLERIK